jgi:hypothetical protein
MEYVLKKEVIEGKKLGRQKMDWRKIGGPDILDWTKTDASCGAGE